MNIYKQILYILVISLFFTIVRFFFIKDDYSIIKSKIPINSSVFSNESNLDSLKNYLNNIKEPEVININLAKKIHKNNLATFIDARDFESYNEKHIRGAINITYEMLEDVAEKIDIDYMLEIDGGYVGTIYNDELMGNIMVGLVNGKSFIIKESDSIDFHVSENVKDENTIFVVYCSGAGCSLSEELGFLMFDRFNLKKILLFEGGMPEWINEKLPTE